MMDIDFIRNRLEAYRVSSVVEEDHAMREILQYFNSEHFAKITEALLK